MTYNQAVEYLYNSLPVFHRVGGVAYKPGLDNSIRLMNAFDNPQNKYKTVHIAGTNGKGSVSHSISAILQSAGYNVGLYTSPHLVDFRERIRVNGEMISEKYVIDFVETNTGLFEEIKPSFFETTMAMAFAYFADCKVDIAVVEVGMGGRLDSTNIINPILSVITNISLDHTQFLGDSLEKIAVEKAGIIKHNTPVIIGETQPETKPVFIEKAQNENAKIIFAEDEFPIKCIDFEDINLVVDAPGFDELRIGLKGEYQRKNVTTTLASIAQLKHIGLNISDKNIRDGFENVMKITGLQGRWQILQSHPTVIVDTGHNKAGIQYVVNQLRNSEFQELHMVIGMVNDKDISSVLALLPKNAVYYFTNANIERALSADNLKSQAEKLELTGESYSTVEKAVRAALIRANVDDMVFIGGSNFVVGEALPLFQIKNTL